MKISLRYLFLLTALFALFSLWLAYRSAELYPGALVQFVDTSGFKNPPMDANAITSEFYATLSKDVESTLSLQMSEEDLRKQIPIEIMNDHHSSLLVRISARGNPLTTNREKLKDIYKLALNQIRSKSSPTTKVKMLVSPQL